MNNQYYSDNFIIFNRLFGQPAHLERALVMATFGVERPFNFAMERSAFGQ